jgi:hypothetical protein
MDPKPNTRRSRTDQHWGNYTVVSRDNQIVAVEPIADDPEPSAIGRGMVGCSPSSGAISQATRPRTIGRPCGCS